MCHQGMIVAQSSLSSTTTSVQQLTITAPPFSIPLSVRKAVIWQDRLPFRAIVSSHRQLPYVCSIEKIAKRIQLAEAGEGCMPLNHICVYEGIFLRHSNMQAVVSCDSTLFRLNTLIYSTPHHRPGPGGNHCGSRRRELFCTDMHTMA